ncbi:UrcA family protein [Qipengyuania sp. 1NDH17]|uniref:UrcA family protein n=1 Tax=Qipengyuania polymorpha TaxID=2867234 RepID=A0ABS7IYS6_9SPHN|nr:UrcA family protein [Qipengyuania polymorpha]MBX7458718.1 UrcA family protein [Qipengyuania polymorpha]
MKFLIAASATALGLLTVAAVPASAQQVRFEVEYADLNLQTAEGIEILDRRIEQAARKACGYGKVTTGSRIPSRKASKCVDELVAKANQQFATLTGKQAKGG